MEAALNPDPLTTRFLGLGLDSGLVFSYPPVISRLGLLAERGDRKALKRWFSQASLVLSLYLSLIQMPHLRYVFTYIIGITSTLAPYPLASSFLAYITQTTPQIPYLFRDKNMEQRRGALVR
jgi:hypothetical protein